ncbi:MAG: Flp pilus assembly complex ATPase component TadA [Planctomycetes bacterium]|nr:Flp pilus assembly complex ATPase component TadA [Planctomycetota bacterium]
MPRKQKQRLGEILLEWGVVTPSAIDEALEHAQKEGLRIGEALIALGLADEEDVTKALAQQYDMEYIDLDRNVVVPTEMHLIPEEIMRRHLVLPLGRENDRLKVVVTDPLDLETLDMLRFRLNSEIEPCLASKSRIRSYIDHYVQTNVSLDDQVHLLEESDGALGDDIAQDGLDEDSAPIIRLVTMIITEAVKMRASDIHIEPMANRVRVRYRIDGVCRERDNIPKRMQGPVINRFKIMAGIDLAERRMPGDGRIKMTVAGSDVDFRVSSLPSYHGESIVLRILRPESAKLGIPHLGFEQEDYQRFLRIIRRPNGVFLVTGPTGSGKTTTLYAAMNELNRPDRKIITAEDPVEYNFTGINQCQVNEQIGVTFARILRAMLRQAPNIILVGEIRDVEVAEVAIQAALTGHLVFSTLHTNDAPSAITRLIDMGVKPFLVASSIQAAMAQRLVRIICKECKEVDPEPDRRTLQLLGFRPDEIEGRTFYKGRGCSACGGTGYHGRQGIFELMEMNNQLRELAFRRAPLNEIRKAARASGMKTLLQDGRLKVMNGVTTAEELVRITQTAELIED